MQTDKCYERVSRNFWTHFCTSKTISSKISIPIAGIFSGFINIEQTYALIRVSAFYLVPNELIRLYSNFDKIISEFVPVVSVQMHWPTRAEWKYYYHRRPVGNYSNLQSHEIIQWKIENTWYVIQLSSVPIMSTIQWPKSGYGQWVEKTISFQLLISQGHRVPPDEETAYAIEIHCLLSSKTFGNWNRSWHLMIWVQML